MNQWNNYTEMRQDDKTRIEDFSNYYGVLKVFFLNYNKKQSIEEITRLNNINGLPDYEEHLRPLLQEELRQRKLLGIDFDKFVSTYYYL